MTSHLWSGTVSDDHEMPALVRWKRQSAAAGGSGEDVTKQQLGTLDKLKEGLQHEVDVIGNATGLKGWQIMLIIVVVAILICGLCGWCVFRFFRKKRKANKGTTGYCNQSFYAASLTSKTYPALPDKGN